ncbi:MAG: hypothetical protein ACXVCE_01050, partial [Bacteriovorax sp.]
MRGKRFIYALVLGSLSFIGLIGPQRSCAQTSYDMKISEAGYIMNISMDFKNNRSLLSVRDALKNPDVLPRLSPNVTSITNSPMRDGHYQSLMGVKSFGISSVLSSSCNESLSENEWKRSCGLETDKFDGGKYMEWKKDEVICIKDDGEKISCHFKIEGKARPVNFLGIQLVNDRVFSVKAKYQALNNFFKLYYFIEDHNISTRQALLKFDRSRIKTELDQMVEEGSRALKSELTYSRRYVL